MDNDQNTHKSIMRNVSGCDTDDTLRDSAHARAHLKIKLPDHGSFILRFISICLITSIVVGALSRRFVITKWFFSKKEAALFMRLTLPSGSLSQVNISPTTPMGIPL
jgi:hypothetical protein